MNWSLPYLSGSHCVGHIVWVTICVSHYVHLKFVIFSDYDIFLTCKSKVYQLWQVLYGSWPLGHSQKNLWSEELSAGGHARDTPRLKDETLGYENIMNGHQSSDQIISIMLFSDSGSSQHKAGIYFDFYALSFCTQHRTLETFSCQKRSNFWKNGRTFLDIKFIIILSVNLGVALTKIGKNRRKGDNRRL